MEKPGVSNLLALFATFTGMDLPAAEAHFEGKGYGHLKTEVAEAVIAELEPLQAKYAKLQNDSAYLRKIVTEGAEKARIRASATLADVYHRVGLDA
ncbi:Tryptophan--tRNA ligase [bioreactor metagenome]|uniref:Tryptophan--tRNA ligase n=1 Tax=bioreactor metagenome TaxID=1076179 RepID=A0A645IFN9_9ZZZZ